MGPGLARSGKSEIDAEQGRRRANGFCPITPVELEGLTTPTDAFYIVAQLNMCDPIYPDD